MAILVDELNKYLAENICPVHNTPCHLVDKGGGTFRIYYCCDEHGKKTQPGIEAIITSFEQRKPGLN